MNEIQKLGANVSNLRKARGLSIKELSIQTDVTSTHLSSFENGNYPLTIKSIVNILNYFNVGLDDCINGKFANNNCEFYIEQCKISLSNIKNKKDTDFLSKILIKIKRFNSDTL